MEEPKNLFYGNKFKFVLSSERFLNNKFEFMITGINIPGMQLGIVNQGTPIKQLERPGDTISYNDLSVEFLISENLDDWKVIYDWLYDLRNFEQTNFDNSIVADGTIVLLTSKNNPNIGIKFTDMYPYNLSDVTLSINVSDPDAIVCEATFKYLDYQFLENV